MFNTRHNFGPPLAIIRFFSSGFAAYTKYSKVVGKYESVGSGVAEWKGCGFCAFGAVVIIPSTLLLMEWTGRKLLTACQDEAGKALLEGAAARPLGKEVGKTKCSAILLIWSWDGDDGGGGVVVVVEVVGQGLNDH
jgi:hypothetical protein